jgi:hypothetical protein
MTKEKKTEYIREPGLCVIRDDDHDWGGPSQEENKPIIEMKEKVLTRKNANWQNRTYY